MNLNVPTLIEQVFNSGCLGKAKRQRDLLTYLLKESQAGRLKKIKEYNIAVDVLERPASFNSTTDSIVRSEMRRLRKNLSLFNNTSAGVQVEIPRASYEVIITNKPQVKPTSPIKPYLKPIVYASTAVALIASLTLANYPQQQSSMVVSNCSSKTPNVGIVNSGSSSDLQLFVGKTLQSSLSQYSNIQFVDHVQACAESGTPSFILDYMVYQNENSYQLAMTISHESSANIVDFTNLSGTLALPHATEELYTQLVRSVGDWARPYGTISKFAITKEWQSKESKDNYQCIMSMYDSFITESDNEYLRSLNCLESSASSPVALLDNKGGLVVRLIDQHRHIRAHTVKQPLAEAGQILDSIGDQWIDSVETVIAKITYEVERPDYNVERLEEVLIQAESRYQENPHVLLAVSIYMGYKIGDWEHAKELSDKIKLIHSDKDNSVFLIDAAYALINETPMEMMETCTTVYSEESLFSNLLINGCAKASNNLQWIAQAQQNLDKLDFPTTPLQIKYIQSRGLEPVFTDKLVAALQLSPSN